jgi:hypothetical protein
MATSWCAALPWAKQRSLGIICQPFEGPPLRSDAMIASLTSDEIDRLYSGGSYEAKLLDALDASVSYDSKRMDGPDDDGAKAQAPKWARAECERRSIKKARWVLTRGHRREGIDSGEIDLGPSISLPSWREEYGPFEFIFCADGT